MKFALRLKELREARGLSQAQLASALGISVGSIGMWESTKEIPPAKKLVILSKFFGVSIDYLVGLSDNPGRSSSSAPEPSREEIDMVMQFRELTRAHQDDVVFYIKALTDSEAAAARSSRKKDIKDPAPSEAGENHLKRSE